MVRTALLAALLCTPACIVVLPGLDTDGAGDDAETTGGTGMTPTQRCDGYCDELVAAGCESGPTLDGCLLTCRSLTSSMTCDPKAHTYFDCVDSATWTCDGNDDPVASGCGLQYLDAIGCATTENPNPAIVTPCTDYCTNIADAACANNGSEDDCNANCLWLGNTGTGCNDEWEGFLTCANGASWSCLLGFAVADGCGTPWDAYWACVDAAGS